MEAIRLIESTIMSKKKNNNLIEKKNFSDSKFHVASRRRNFFAFWRRPQTIPLEVI